MSIFIPLFAPVWIFLFHFLSVQQRRPLPKLKIKQVKWMWSNAIFLDLRWACRRGWPVSVSVGARKMESRFPRFGVRTLGWGMHNSPHVLRYLVPPGSLVIVSSVSWTHTSKLCVVIYQPMFPNKAHIAPPPRLFSTHEQFIQFQ